MKPSKMNAIDWHTTRREISGGTRQPHVSPDAVREIFSESEETEPGPSVEIHLDPTLTKAKAASEYLKGILLNMGLSGRIAASVRFGSIYLEILGAEPGLVIGHRGQNLDALQHLVNRMVNRDTGHLVPVTVDADNYRSRRHEQLQKMVSGYCREVLDGGRSKITEPMTPSERRLFHIAANRVPGIKTTSFGSGFFQPIKVYAVNGADSKPPADEQVGHGPDETPPGGELPEAGERSMTGCDGVDG